MLNIISLAILLLTLFIRTSTEENKMATIMAILAIICVIVSETSKLF